MLQHLEQRGDKLVGVEVELRQVYVITVKSLCKHGRARDALTIQIGEVSRL